MVAQEVCSFIRIVNYSLITFNRDLDAYTRKPMWKFPKSKVFSIKTKIKFANLRFMLSISFHIQS